jgi:Cd2+/Zn2+-exporting ATPase
LEVLVIACPCALVLSTPVTTVSAIARAARSGILVKGGHILEILASIKVMSFDKTGTLTKGTFVIKCVNMGDDHSTQDVHRILKMIGSLERSSNHPIASAILAKAASLGITCDLNVTSTQTIPGAGISGLVDGHLVNVGTANFVSETLIAEQKSMLSDLCSKNMVDGCTFCFVSIDQKFACRIEAKDAIREEAKESITRLNNIGVSCLMLTGDNESVARVVAQEAGINECNIHASLLPEDKLRLVSHYQNTLTPRIEKTKSKDVTTLAHVGDGINDAPALAAVHVGIAMGFGGSAAVLEAADTALFTNDLRVIPELIRLSKTVRRVIIFNIVFSVLTKVSVLALAILGWFTLWAAVLVDVGTAILVTLMGLRLLQFKFNLENVCHKCDAGKFESEMEMCCSQKTCSGHQCSSHGKKPTGCSDDGRTGCIEIC